MKHLRFFSLNFLPKWTVILVHLFLLSGCFVSNIDVTMMKPILPSYGSITSFEPLYVNPNQSVFAKITLLENFALTTANLDISGGSLVALTGSGKNYEAELIAGASGDLSIGLKDTIPKSLSLKYSSPKLTKFIITTPNYAYVSFEKNDVVVTEGNQKISMNMILYANTPLDHPVEVKYKIIAPLSTLTFGVDHNLPSEGTVVFPAGSTSQAFSFDVYQNPLSHTNRFLYVYIENTDTQNVGIDEGLFRLKIIDNEVAPAALTFKKIAAGLAACGIATNDDLYCWGGNAYSQVGDGTVTDAFAPIHIDSPTKYAEVSNYGNHTCAITTSGTLKCWGNNNYKQIGNNAGTATVTAPTVIDGTVTYSKVATGEVFTCAITTAGVLKCWGANFNGQLGQGNTTQYGTPQIVDGSTVYKDLSLGNAHGCAITDNNSLKCWGANNVYQVGDGTNVDKSTVVAIDGSVKYESISLGSAHACGVTDDAQLKCWGRNGNNQLGNGTNVDITVPSRIDVTESYESVRAGLLTTCARTTDDKIKCTGINGNGQMGIGHRRNMLSFTTVSSGKNYIDYDLGQTFGCNILADGHLACSGFNTTGTLGLNTFAQLYQLSATKIMGDDLFTSIVETSSSSCGITTNHLLKCIGGNSNGVFGNGIYSTTGTIPVPMNSRFEFRPNSLQKLVGGYCDIAVDGTLRCWGSNSSGQLGDGTKGNTRLSPIIIDSGTKYKKVSGATNHSCGITTLGRLKCWGTNANGQLGIGTTAESLTPTVVDNTNTYIDVSTGFNYTCAITTAGLLRCFGYNNVYQIGDGTTTTRLSPVDIDSSTIYKKVDLGYNHSCAITSTDNIKCWGPNGNKVLGDGTTLTRSTPSASDASYKYSKIVLGFAGSTCGLTLNNEIRCWGYNGAGQLGVGTLSIVTSDPVFVDAGVKYKDLSVASNTLCAIVMDTGEVKCFGSDVSNSTGTGIGMNARWATPVSP